jgi:hypothetical protein
LVSALIGFLACASFARPISTIVELGVCCPGMPVGTVGQGRIVLLSMSGRTDCCGHGRFSVESARGEDQL